MVDKVIRVPAGERRPMPLAGVDYVYLKRALEPIVLVVDQQSHTMGQNDKKLFAQRLTGTEEVYVENNSGVDQTLLFDVGQGDFSRQVIEGELNVVPSIIREDGSVHPDRRIWLDLQVDTQQFFTELPTEAGQLIGGYQAMFSLSDPEASLAHPSSNLGFDAMEGFYYWARQRDGKIEKINIATGELIETKGFSVVGYRLTQDFCFLDESQFLTVDEGGYIYLRSWMDTTAPEHHIFRIPPVLNGRQANLGEWGIAVDKENDRCYLSVPKIDNSAGEARLVTCEFNAELAVFGNVISDITVRMPVGYENRAVHCSKPFYSPEFGWVAALSTSPTNKGIVENRPFFYQIETGDRVVSLEEHFDYKKHNKGYLSVDLVYYDGLWHGFERYGQYISGDHRTIVYKTQRWPSTSTYTGRGKAQQREEKGSQSWRFKNDDGLVYTRAAVKNLHIGGGRYQFTGEVIKAALELFLRRPVYENYLDRVYGVKIWDTGQTQKYLEYYSGNYSFKRDGIPDRLKMVVPGRIELFIEPDLLEI